MTKHASQFRRGVRLRVTNKATPSPMEDYEREVLRLTKLIHQKERKRRELKQQAEMLTKELRAHRRGLRTILFTQQAALQPFEFDSNRITTDDKESA
jgi:hypothetical protein